MSDPIYFQLQESISTFNKVESRKRIEEKTHSNNNREIANFPDLVIFTYKLKKSDDLFSVAAAANLPYDTLATINRASTPEAFKKLTTVFIPSLPGLFVPVKPVTSLEDIMYSWRRNERKEYQKITLHNLKDNSPTAGQTEKTTFLFYLNDRFHPVERAFFLNILFRFPLPRGVITSPYGERISPFTGHPEFHTGIDIAAPLDTNVYAARDGIVSATGYNRVYGNYIVISHEGGYQTLYGHLNKISVRLHNKIRSGMIIGKVGATGMATGPHLHFEIRRKGKTTDPVPLLPIKDRIKTR